MYSLLLRQLRRNQLPSVPCRLDRHQRACSMETAPAILRSLLASSVNWRSDPELALRAVIRVYALVVGGYERLLIGPTHDLDPRARIRCHRWHRVLDPTSVHCTCRQGRGFGLSCESDLVNRTSHEDEDVTEVSRKAMGARGSAWF